MSQPITAEHVFDEMEKEAIENKIALDVPHVLDSFVTARLEDAKFRHHFMQGKNSLHCPGPTKLQQALMSGKLGMITLGKTYGRETLKLLP